jgi:ligand-binding sensor domain-containing protein
MRIFTLIITVCLGINLYAQDNLSFGQWRSLLPYTKGKYVTQTPDEVWYASDQSIIIFDKDEMSTTFFDKVDGLSDVDIKILEYSPENDLLVAAYNNSNIDIISRDRSTVFNMSDIKRDIELQGDKGIYDIYFLETDAYLATGFGVMKINLIEKEVAFTTFTNIRVNSVTSLNNTLYAATDEGIYYAPLSNFNLLDFTAWGKLDIDDGFPDDYTSRVVHSYEDELYMDINDSLFVMTDTGLEFIIHEPDFSVGYLQDGKDDLIIQLQKFPFNGQQIYTRDDSGILTSQIPAWCIAGLGYATIQDEQGRFWIGDSGKGFQISEPGTGSCSIMNFNSPYSVSNFNMKIVDDELWVAGGGITQSWGFASNPSGFAKYSQGEWTIFNSNTEDALEDMKDMVDVEINEETGIVYVGSYSRGLTLYDGTNLTIYNTGNSSLESPTNDPGSCRVPGLALDDDNNLWMSNSSVSNPIVVLQPDGNWKSFPFSGIQALLKAAIDPIGNKWFTTSGFGIVVFNEGDDWDNHADNESRVINPSNSELTTDIVYDITLDLDGDMWAGTDEGIIIFECGGNVFDASCQGTKRIIEREDGNNAHLLESESVRCIAVDGANRKWCGTTNGVFLISEDGLDEIFHFTEDNSPLFSNIINDIVINERTGEVYIGTNNGIITYQGDATVGGVVHDVEVFAFPNPVRPDYKGPIAIRGLPQNANVKITDVSGTLIYETTANGGQAIWDGKDYNGREASSGVYLVFSVNKKNLTNPDGYVTKILKMK